MKRYFIFFCFISVLAAGHAQPIAGHKQMPGNTLFLEIGGRASLYSINYERIIYQAGEHRFSAKGGFGYFPRVTKREFTENGRALSVDFGILYFPVGVSWIKGFGRNGHHFFEIGITRTFELNPGYDIFGFQSSTTTRWVTVPSIGYRYQKPEGLSLSLSYTPHIGNESLGIWFGAAVGKSF